ncbi:MAG: PAS domain S-box protein [Gammaproteobacteria bacterium]|nr:PAS domain S-box protein [Gammaproteobacteria bacterium]
MNAQYRNSIEQIISIKEMKALQVRMLRHLITTIVVLLCILFLGSWYSFNFLAQNELGNTSLKAEAQLNTIQSLQGNNLNFLKSTVFQLAKDSELRRFVVDRNQLSRELILDHWITIAERLSWISQIRFIANSGYELLRIDYDPKIGLAENFNVLQNKKNSDYYIQAKLLNRNEMYISPISLNREYNEISYPITPVIRLAMPVFQSSGQASGILVVNFLADKLIASINDITANTPGKTALLDEHGNYLQGFGTPQNWIHELEPDSITNFAQQHPAVWDSMTGMDSGNLLVNGERFIFQTTEYTDNSEKPRRYTVVQHITDADVRADYANQSIKLYLLFFCLFILCIITPWAYYKNRLVKELEHNALELISALFYSKEPIFITNPALEIEIVNSAFSEATGYGPTTVEGMACEGLYIFDNEDTQSSMKKSLEETGQWNGEVLNLHKDGHKRTNLMFASAVKDKTDAVTHYVFQMLDISDRKAMENDLKIAAAAFETRSAITITDSKGNIIQVNKAFTEITGYPAAAVIGKNPSVLSSGKHDANFYQRLWASLLEQGYWQGEIWNRHKNGTVYPEWINISSIKNEKGEVIHYVATFEDITTRKQLEAQIATLTGRS